MNAKHLLIILLFFISTGNMNICGMPAYTKEIPVVLEDGIAYIRLFGDEHNKRAENADGYTIIQKGGVWYYAEPDTQNGVKASKYKLHVNSNKETKKFLGNIPKHLTRDVKRSPSVNFFNVEGTEVRNINDNLANKRVIGERKILVILMQYKDIQMIKSQDDFNALFNEKEYSEDGAQGSVCDFYTDVSYGQLQLTCDIVGPFTSKYERAYYGGNNSNDDDVNPGALFEEAINHAIKHVSLADYDSDGDGFVDNIHIIFAGHGEEAGASDDAIWSHEASFYKPYEIQGMKIDRYSCAPELRGGSGKGISRIGPHCHEIGHALGAMDYYDTDSDVDGKFSGTGYWDVMASGSWNNDGITPADFNPYVKIFDFGWVVPQTMPSGEVTIQPSCETSQQYYLFKSTSSSECYIIENRSRKKWGQGIPGEGLLIFHIHPDISNSGNRINSKAPQKCYVVCASSNIAHPNSMPSSYGNINSAGCPFPGVSNNTDFGPNSVPAAFFWEGDECGIELNNIYIDAEANIHLVNNTIGEHDGSIDHETVFFENFENDNIKITIYRDDSNTFAPCWMVESNPQSPSKVPTKPTAYKGDRCLQLSSNKTNQATSSFSFEIPGVSERAEGKLKLKFYVNTFNPKTDTPNTVHVSYCTTDNGEWLHKEVKPMENNRWAKYIIDLPDNVLPQITIEGTAYLGSVLAIDNLEVERIIENNDVSVRDVKASTKNVVRVFSPLGVMYPNLNRGINIVKGNDGKIYKVFSK